METAPLKSFATWARIALIREVNARIVAVLAPASKDRVESASVVAALERDIAAGGGGETGRDAIADKVAYTWFNRIIALRFMDANGYTGIGIVSPPRGQTTGQPEVLADAKRGSIDPAVVTNKRTIEAITALLDGTRRSDDAQGEAYALLLAEYCRHWNRSMPFMFEREGDYTELLIPSNMLADDSVIARATTVLTEDVCQDVEVIGWLYQFYISERKDEVFAGFKKNKKAGAPEIPAATQLFTPHWIVRYLVENSLGRLWLLNRPTSRLAEQMEYYLAPVDEEIDFLKIETPEELKVIDPACGSGHMLTYAFDLLYSIYEEEGYAPADISGLILQHNLFGAEIDPRAGVLAAFALAMKARARQRTFFSKGVQPNVCVLEPIHFDPAELDYLWSRSKSVNIARADADTFWNRFEHADTLGSLIQPSEKLVVPLKRYFEDHPASDGDILAADVHAKVTRVIRQAEFLTPKYSVLVANPPYMGSGNMGDRLAQFAGRNFKTSKYDLFAMFIERSFSLVCPRGVAALVTMEAWMTGAAYAKFRSEVVFKQDLRSLVHMPYLGKGRTAMGINFGISAMVLRRAVGGSDRAAFQCIRHYELDDFGVPIEFPVRNERFSLVRMDEFTEIPGMPVIYAASSEDLAALAARPKVSDLVTTREGLTTGDNDRFLRRWFEVSSCRIAPPDQVASSGFTSHRWYMYVKGGEFRRWYGNLDFVVDWENSGERVKVNVDTKTGRVRSHNYNGEFGFLEGLTWSGVSSSRFSARYVPAGHMFDAKGPMGFGGNRTNLLAAMAVLNSGAADRYLGMLAPNLDFKLGHVLNLPAPAAAAVRDELSQIAEEAILASKALWDEAETSADFDRLPIIRRSARAEDCVTEVARQRADIAATLSELRSQVDAVLSAERQGQEVGRESLDDDSETAVIPVAERMRDLMSYAVGCMLGRYSLDEPGLILANQGDTLQEYLAKVPKPSFMPDKDNVIPIVDGDWFEDDIVARFRQFLRVAFGEEYFEENLRFVTDSLDVKDLRDYFLKSFYKDHVQRYKKRPIYWLFSSPKGSFNALIYMHRYTPSTVSTVLNEYLREFKAKLEASRQHHVRLAAGDGTPREKAAAEKEVDRLRKVLLELDEYEHGVLYPLATQQLAIDLDDGVKANYSKFADALKKIPGLDAIDE
ncbi:hypothetical protein ABIB15_002545 [Marisediminicola sp. UYEF4]|uniref:BREX-1 system adenine-specific DNA-methyltransferase PglX n=1 Tax=Marisediminicola sp. UYEF4 TaxID=1756384 RepID=UPI0033978053